MKYEAVVIGVSAGGMEALKAILPVLRAGFPAPVIIVQHTWPDADSFLARYLNDLCRIRVKEAEEKEVAAPGIAYIAPANYHLLIEKDKTFSLSVGEKVNYARPSIDVLFESAADVYGAGAVGIILTGASSDGSMGLKKIKDYGGFTIVQDPESAEAQVMPKAAIEAAEIDEILPLTELGNFLNTLIGAQHE